MRLNLLLLFYCTITLIGCKEDGTSDCNSRGSILETFVTPEGTEVYIFADGTTFFNNNGSCEFLIQYYDPDFLINNYKIDATGKFIKTDGGLLPVKNDFYDNMETYSTFTDLFLKSITDTHLFWNSFTLQSPATPTVNDYVSLRSCILNNTCTFIDNKIELISDPMNPTNQILKFTSVTPTASMVTAKTSIESLISFFDKGSDLWFQSDFLIKSGMPFSIVDFENSYFDGRPGPRVVVRNNELSIENKFGAKKEYFQSAPVKIPMSEWFTVKVHLKFSNTNDGIIELWQDGVKIISATGINLPTSNSVQNTIEVGITATSLGSVLLMDNIKISESPF